MIGDSEVGKSQLISTLINQEYHEEYSKTENIEIYEAFFMIESILIKLNIWDMGAEENLLAFLKGKSAQVFRNVSSILLIFDVCNVNSFERLTYWNNFIKTNINQNIPIIIVGNKIDNEMNRVVSTSDIMNIADDFGYAFITTSAKDNFNVERMFEMAAEELKRIAEEQLLIINHPPTKNNIENRNPGPCCTCI